MNNTMYVYIIYVDWWLRDYYAWPWLENGFYGVGDIGKGWVVRGYNPLFRNE